MLHARPEGSRRSVYIEGGVGWRYFYERIWLFMMGDIPVVELRKGSEMCIYLCQQTRKAWGN